MLEERLPPESMVPGVEKPGPAVWFDRHQLDKLAEIVKEHPHSFAVRDEGQDYLGVYVVDPDVNVIGKHLIAAN